MWKKKKHYRIRILFFFFLEKNVLENTYVWVQGLRRHIVITTNSHLLWYVVK